MLAMIYSTVRTTGLSLAVAIAVAVVAVVYTICTAVYCTVHCPTCTVPVCTIAFLKRDVRAGSSQVCRLHADAKEAFDSGYCKSVSISGSRAAFLPYSSKLCQHMCQQELQ